MVTLFIKHFLFAVVDVEKEEARRKKNKQQIQVKSITKWKQ